MSSPCRPAGPLGRGRGRAAGRLAGRRRRPGRRPAVTSGRHHGADDADEHGDLAVLVSGRSSASGLRAGASRRQAGGSTGGGSPTEPGRPRGRPSARRREAGRTDAVGTGTRDGGCRRAGRQAIGRRATAGAGRRRPGVRPGRPPAGRGPSASGEAGGSAGHGGVQGGLEPRRCRASGATTSVGARGWPADARWRRRGRRVRWRPPGRSRRRGGWTGGARPLTVPSHVGHWGRPPDSEDGRGPESYRPDFPGGATGSTVATVAGNRSRSPAVGGTCSGLGFRLLAWEPNGLGSVEEGETEA